MRFPWAFLWRGGHAHRCIVLMKYKEIATFDFFKHLRGFEHYWSDYLRGFEYNFRVDAATRVVLFLNYEEEEKELMVFLFCQMIRYLHNFVYNEIFTQLCQTHQNYISNSL